MKNLSSKRDSLRLDLSDLAKKSFSSLSFMLEKGIGSSHVLIIPEIICSGSVASSCAGLCFKASSSSSVAKIVVITLAVGPEIWERKGKEMRNTYVATRIVTFGMEIEQ